MRLENLSRWAFSAALALFVAGSSAAAQDGADDLPALHIIACNDKCTNFIPARPILHGSIPDMSTFQRTLNGFVLLQYVVGVDGKVRSVDLLQRQGGPDKFIEAVVATVKAWTFEPAKLNGKSIETTRTYQVTLFGPGNDLVTRQFVRDAYSRGTELIQSGKYDEALSALNGAGSLLELNFFERSILAYPLALIAFKKQDYLETRRLVGLAHELGTGHLPQATEWGLWELRVESDLLLGDMVDANWSYQKNRRDFSYESLALKLLNKANATVDALPVLPVMAKIPPREEGDVFWFNLYRNTFSFQTMSGSLEKFTLLCNPQMMESKITETAQWRVPKSWGQCSLMVHGAPGSTFRVLQSNS